MTDKQAVLDALSRLPENATLEEIAEELRTMAAIRQGREDVAAGRTKSHEEAEKLFQSWATAWAENALRPQSNLTPEDLSLQE